MKTRPIWPIVAILTGITAALVSLKVSGMIGIGWPWVLSACWLPTALMLSGLLIGHFFAGNKPSRRN